MICSTSVRQHSRQNCTKCRITKRLQNQKSNKVSRAQTEQLRNCEKNPLLTCTFVVWVIFTSCYLVRRFHVFHFKSTPVCFPTCSVVKQYLKLPKKFPLNLYSLEVSLNCQSDILFNLSRTVVLVWYTEFQGVVFWLTVQEW